MPIPPLEILLPNGQVLAVQMYIWDGTEPQKWDGNISVVLPPGTEVVANQGAAGVDPWPVLASIDTTGLATESKQDTEITKLTSIDNKLSSPIDVDATGSIVAVSNFPATQPVSGPLTDVQLRATPVPINGTVTVDTSLLSTAAKQDTGNASLAQIDTNTDPFLVSGAGAYVRQDSTGTIAKEAGGNLAIVKTNTDTLLEITDSKADLAKVGSPNTTLSTSNTTPITTAATTDVVSAPSSGNHLEITRLHVTNGSTTSVKVSFKEASGSQVFHCNLPQYGIMSLDLKSGWHLTTATKLQMVTDAAGSIDYTISYRTVPD